MKEGQKLFKIEALVSRDSLKKPEGDFTSEATTIFRLLKDAKIDVKEVWIHTADVIKRPSHLELSIGGSGYGCEANGWKKC